MKTLEYKVQEGIGAICQFLPVLAKNRENTELRDYFLRTAAQLLDGQIINALLHMKTVDGDEFFIAIGDCAQERKQMLDMRLRSIGQAPANVISFPIPTRAIVNA